MFRPNKKKNPVRDPRTGFRFLSEQGDIFEKQALFTGKAQKTYTCAVSCKKGVILS